MGMRKNEQQYKRDDPNTVTPRIDAEREAAAKLYPSLGEIERREAIANLRRYFEIALAQERVDVNASLTQPGSVPTMKERSNEILKT